MNRAAEHGTKPRRAVLIGLLALVWYSLGCLGFALTNTRVPAYIAQLSPSVVDYIDALPAWAIIAWGDGAGLGLIGSLLLIDRSTKAIPVFALSLLGIAASLTYPLANGLPLGMDGGLGKASLAAVLIVAAALVGYALRLRTPRVRH